MNIVALIPARGGSKGIKNKNITLVKNKPLIAHTIIVAKKCKLIDEIYVSTDSEKIKKCSIKFGAKAPFSRPKNISRDRSTDLQAMLHFNNWYLNFFKKRIDLIVHLSATTPFRKPKMIDKAISIMIKKSEYTSLRSFVETKLTPFKMWVKKNNRAIPIIKTKKEYHSMGRQFIPKTYEHAGYVDIIKPKETINKNSMVGKKVFFFKIDRLKEKYIDIDDKKDLLSIK